MSQKQKRIEQAIREVRAGKRTFSSAEIEGLKRTVALQRSRRNAAAKQKHGSPAVTDFGKARRGAAALGRRLPGSFESK